MSIGSRIKELRENKHIPRNKFAEMIGVTVGAISNYENDVSSPKEPILFKIIETLECEPNYIFQDMVKIKTQNNDVSLSEYDHIKKYRALDSHGKEMVDFTLLKEWERSQTYTIQASIQEQQPQIHARLINYYYKLASAGTGQIVFDTPPTDKIEIPNTPEYRKVDYAIGVNGNSMEPEYYDGDILLVEMTEEINEGEIGIFIVDKESYVKKMGDAELISLNPNYGNIPLTEHSKCMGKVIGKL